MRYETAQHVEQLRRKVIEQNACGILLPHMDRPQNQYAAERVHRLSWLTGFRGSVGLAVVLLDQAALFVDGRYTLQAQQQIDSALFSVQPQGPVSLKQWMSSSPSSPLNPTFPRSLLYDPWLHSAHEISTLEKQLATLEIHLVPTEMDILADICPPLPLSLTTPFFPYDLQWAGKTFEEKRAVVDTVLEKNEADCFVLTHADSLSWLLNVRGGDTPYTPSCQGFCLFHRQGPIQVFAKLDKVTAAVRRHCGPNVLWIDLVDFPGALSTLGKKKVLANFHQVPQKILNLLKGVGAAVHAERDPCTWGAALKNPIEQQHARTVHEIDGLAVIHFLAWLDRTWPTKTVTELDADAFLLTQRQRQPHFQGPSFCSISAFGPHGAVVHYHPTPETDAPLEPSSLYLIDSGGQYWGGTTDITRTVAIGTPTAEQRDRFTRVLKGHIALAQAVFPRGTIGAQLDILARQFLWQVGLDYEHSTGHGVGNYLNVHEGPHHIGKRADGVALEPGMLVTNEPGYYKTDAYGIRLENITLVTPQTSNTEMLCLETLTLVPFDKKLMDLALLTPDEIRWINTYHARIAAVLSSRIDEEAQAWFQQATSPLGDCLNQ